MGILKNLFSPDSTNTIVDGIAKGIDSANFTEQERAQLKIKLLDALAPFKIVQRILAFAAVAHWLLAGFNVIASIWIREMTEGRINAVEPLLEYALSDYVFWPTVAVFSLYCSGGVIESYTKTRDKK